MKNGSFISDEGAGCVTFLCTESGEDVGEDTAGKVEAVEFLPREEFDFAVFSVESLGDGARGAAHVSVGGCLAINWVAELEPLLDGIWTEVEDVAVRGVSGVVLVCHDALCDFCIGECDMRGSEGVDIDAHGVGLADCIGHLDKHTVGDACSDEVLGYVPGGISGRAVDLGGVFA